MKEKGEGSVRHVLRVFWWRLRGRPVERGLTATRDGAPSSLLRSISDPVGTSFVVETKEEKATDCTMLTHFLLLSREDALTTLTD